VPEPARKKTCIRKSKTEPDVTIVVGGVEFKELGSFLCYWSEYFSAALASGMKETETKHFEFPDRDPEEWEWIISLMVPMSKVKLTKEKLDVALSWFDELCCPVGLEECDRILCEETLEQLAREVRSGEYDLETTASLLDVLDTAVRYQLHHSKKRCLERLGNVLPQSGQNRTVDLKMLERIVSLIKVDEECKNGLKHPLKDFWPQTMSMSDEQEEVLIQNGMLHHFLWMQTCWCHESELASELSDEIRPSFSFLPTSRTPRWSQRSKHLAS
jgi:hypothetical protein